MAVPQNYIYAKKSSKNKKYIFIFYAFIFLGPFTAIAYFVFFTPYFNVKKISFHGMNVVKETDLMRISDKYLETSEYYFLKQKNILTMSSYGLTEAFKAELRRVKNISVDKKFPNVIDVLVEEYYPAGIVCDNIDIQSQKCFYFDIDGTVFDEAPFIVGEALLFVYDENLGVATFPEYKYDFAFVKFISEFKKNISEKSVFTIDYFKDSNKFGDIEAFFRLGFKVFLSQNQDPEEQAKAVAEIINSQAENVQNIEYVDLRIKNRAYYKLKNIDNQIPQ